MVSKEKKYATLRQLKFQKEMPMLYLQAKIRKLEFELSLLPTRGEAVQRQYLEYKLAPLYKMMMGYAKQE